MILDDVYESVHGILETEIENDVSVTRDYRVPSKGPTNKGVWLEIPGVTAVFTDMRESTRLNTESGMKDAARVYAWFVRSLAKVADAFQADYIDVQGDAVFALFSANKSWEALAAAVTARTFVQRVLAKKLAAKTHPDWELHSGTGVDVGTVLVRRLGVRRDNTENEVWAGVPLNSAAKLARLGKDEVIISDRVKAAIATGSKLRRRVVLKTCGCSGEANPAEAGLDAPDDLTTDLWTESPAPKNLGLNFSSMWRLGSAWCSVHGKEFCEALVTDVRPSPPR